jgi:hypothetical protein
VTRRSALVTRATSDEKCFDGTVGRQQAGLAVVIVIFNSGEISIA